LIFAKHTQLSQFTIQGLETFIFGFFFDKGVGNLAFPVTDRVTIDIRDTFSNWVSKG
jgi:hypothetical protein